MAAALEYSTLPRTVALLSVGMAADAFVHCRVSPATKLTLRAAAERQQVFESALLKRMLHLRLAGADSVGKPQIAHAVPARAGPSVRLTPCRLSSGNFAAEGAGGPAGREDRHLAAAAVRVHLN